jgi:hypothetical protein
MIKTASTKRKTLVSVSLEENSPVQPCSKRAKSDKPSLRLVDSPDTSSEASSDDATDDDIQTACGTDPVEEEEDDELSTVEPNKLISGVQSTALDSVSITFYFFFRCIRVYGVYRLDPPPPLILKTFCHQSTRDTRSR